jgi:hypothetical protein
VTNLLSAPRRLARARFLVVFGVARVAGIVSRAGENPAQLYGKRVKPRSFHKITRRKAEYAKAEETSWKL